MHTRVFGYAHVKVASTGKAKKPLSMGNHVPRSLWQINSYESEINQFASLLQFYSINFFVPLQPLLGMANQKPIPPDSVSSISGIGLGADLKSIPFH